MSSCGNITFSACVPGGLSPRDRKLIESLKQDIKPKKKTVICKYCETARDLNENYNCLNCGATSFTEME